LNSRGRSSRLARASANGSPKFSTAGSSPRPWFASATCGTIRLKLWKIGAQVRRSLRRIKLAMAAACPYQAEYHLADLYLRRAAAF
jgi:hypothetical protein